MVTRLIWANVIVFIIVNIARFFIRLKVGADHVAFQEALERFLKFFAISSDLFFDLTHPWVIFTNMFLHEGVWHIAINMLFLMWFGRIVGDLIGNRRILPLYLITGLAGAFLYLATAKWFYDKPSMAYGASAAVMGIMATAGTLAPDYNIRLILIGDVKLKYIVMFFLLLDIIGFANMENTGGHIAHLGGALMGFFFTRQLQVGHDWSEPINQIFDSITAFFSRFWTGKGPGPRVAYRDPDLKVKAKAKAAQGKTARSSKKGSSSSDLSHQEQLDAILDKIKHSGYESLTAEEKEFLFNASKKHE